jgi:hypothetical protein
MVTGNTNTGALADSLSDIRNNARQIREQEGVMTQVVDVHTLGEGIGLSWNEVSFNKITAQSATETTELDNPQQLVDNLLSVTPQLIGITHVITDRVQARISSASLAQIGTLGQNAITRKADQDGLATLDSATTSLGSAGTTLTSGHASAAVNRIQGNATEPGPGPYRFVHHPFTFKDIQDELVAGINTYPVESGLTANVFAQGFRGMMFEAQVYKAGNLSIDSANDAKGGIFSQMAIVLIRGRAPRIVPVRNEKLGGGATELVHWDEYAFGIRQQAWLFEMYFDATAATS